MNVLKRLWTWWGTLWDCDCFWDADIDSHRWENKAEILRRLSS